MPIGTWHCLLNRALPNNASRHFCSQDRRDCDLPKSTMSAARAISKFRWQQFANRLPPIARYGEIDCTAPKGLPNPFIPRRNSKTGKWIPPKYSLRQQADIIKKAKQSNMLHLIPPGPKFSQPLALADALRAKADTNTIAATSNPEIKHKLEDEPWMEPVDWVGEVKVKVVAGSETGTRLYAAKKRMFKGHKWERVREKREKKRSILMRDMAKRVYNYKAVSGLSSRVRPGHVLTRCSCSIINEDGRIPSNRRVLQRPPNCHSSTHSRRYLYPITCRYTCITTVFSIARR